MSLRARDRNFRLKNELVAKFVGINAAVPWHARALATCLPRQDHVYITTDESCRFHNNEFDEMPCKLYSTENPRQFDKYCDPTPPERDT